MFITLKPGWPPQRIAATGQTAVAGELVEVDDGVGESLCEQTDKWAKAKPPKKTSEGTNKDSGLTAPKE